MHIEELKRIITEAVAECGELMRVVPDTLDELDTRDARDAIVAAVNRANDPTEIVQALGRRINDDADLVIDALVVRALLGRLLDDETASLKRHERTDHTTTKPNARLCAIAAEREPTEAEALKSRLRIRLMDDIGSRGYATLTRRQAADLSTAGMITYCGSCTAFTINENDGYAAVEYHVTADSSADGHHFACAAARYPHVQHLVRTGENPCSICRPDLWPEDDAVRAVCP